MGRVATLLSAAEGYSSVEQEEEEDGQESKPPSSYFDAAGRRACLLATVGVCLCPLPWLWPALWPTRRAQRRRLRSTYPHFPSLAPTSSSSSSLAGSRLELDCGPYLCFPCTLAEEQAFLEAATEQQLTAARSMAAMQREGSSKGRAAKTGAVLPLPFDPEQGWDMRPIVDEVVVEEEESGNGDGGGWGKGK